MARDGVELVLHHVHHVVVVVGWLRIDACIVGRYAPMCGYADGEMQYVDGERLCTWD